MCGGPGRGKPDQAGLGERDGVAAGGEGFQARLDPLAAPPDGRLEFLAGERQDLRAGERPEQACRDDAAILVGDPLHVEGDETLGPLPRNRGDFLGVGECLAGRRLLEDAVGPVRGCDQRRAVGRDQAALHGAPRLHHLGGDDDVDVARGRHHREDRRPPALRDHLDIIERRPGALRDAGHRGRLHVPAVALAERDQPVGNDAAALPADRQDRNRDRPLASDGVHDGRPDWGWRFPPTNAVTRAGMQASGRAGPLQSRPSSARNLVGIPE